MSMKGLQRSPSFIKYSMHLKDRLEEIKTSLETEKDHDEIFRKQGQIVALKFALELPETVEESERLDVLAEEAFNDDVHEY